MKAGYRLWNYQKDEVICSRDVRFNEKCTNFDEITKGMEDYKEEKIISIQNFTEKSENGEDKVEETIGMIQQVSVQKVQRRVYQK